MALYVHQAYQGLYQLYTEQDKHSLAKAMLKNALEWTYELKEKKAYKFKLYQLEQKNRSNNIRVQFAKQLFN